MIKTAKKNLCVLQFHYTDLMPLLDDYNCISKLQESGIFDDIVLAVADIQENQILIDYAKKWEVDIHFGSVDNVHLRFMEIIEKYNADIILRVLPQWYFIDVDLIESMVDFLKDNKADYLSLRNNFDIRFAGDLFTKELFQEVDQKFSSDDDLRDKFKFNPWGFVDLFADQFNSKVLKYNEVPTYPASEFTGFKEIYNKVWPEHWDNADTPMFPYDLATRYIANNPEMNVLDIACGFGTGSAHLKKQGAKNVTGVDISEHAVSHCISKYSGIENLSFLNGDALSLNFDEDSFDLIVSIHTMEHVIDDNLFLQQLKLWLKPNSKIVLEVPLLMKYPFAESAEPYGDAHIREYEVDALIAQFKNYFELIDAYGVSRGFYTKISNARNAVLVVGQNNL